MPDLYRATLDQIQRVDELGYDSVWLTEHHFVEAGYLPSPLTVSGTIAAVTRRVRIGQDVLLLPHYHPVRLAEDLVVLDNLSGGRMMLGVGMGYVPSEFRAPASLIAAIQSSGPPPWTGRGCTRTPSSWNRRPA